MKSIAPIKQSLTYSLFTAEYVRHRGSHPALAPYAAPEDVLRALTQATGLSYEDRNAITLALIAAHRRPTSSRAHGVWQSLLFVAFEGMLVNVERRILGGDPEENEQWVLAGFVEALSKVSLEAPPSHLSLALRHETERQAFRGCFDRAASDADVEIVDLSDARKERDPHDLEAELQENDQLSAIVAELVALFGGEDMAREALDVLLEARTGRAALEAYIEDRNPGMSRVQRTATYARLHRMRTRALARLEKRFGRDSTERALQSA